MKICKKHNKAKFYKNGACVECQKRKSAEWRLKNKKYAIIRDKKYREKNKEKLKNYARTYAREKNKIKPEKYLIDENGYVIIREKIIRVKRVILRRCKMRFETLERDNFTCQYCGRKAPEVVLQVDHIHPRSKGGLDKLENYRTACRDCNIGKGNNILKIVI